MNSTLTPPVYFPVSSVGIDRVLTVINNQLSVKVPKISYVLGRVMPQLVEGRLEPWINRPGTDEYYQAYPNDTLEPMSFSCIYCHENESWINDYNCTRTISIIVWANLTQIEMSLEELKRQVLFALRDLYCLQSSTPIRIRDQTTSGASGIYPGFDVSGFEERYLTMPYGGFRLEAVATYEDVCYSL